ncbi:MAG: nucleotidyltransferase domain-containing protein [Cellvibrio sp.]|uniref:nucleotidyltransferase domain-containing protein n=1 Tax=Cellvibrio sp. TaxID=1965322 RepID=UPI0031A57A8B
MIPNDIHNEILKRIKAAEKEHNVKVLFAIESGSRAWGFASPNSDYDVRFIYVHPRDWYLTIDVEDKRDVIEYPIVDEIDINGWDIRKALKLLWKSNPGIVEWLQSPIVYVDDGIFASAARSLLPTIYSPKKGIYHYLSMAKTNYRGHLKEDIVPIKKYFYVLRPLLSIMWLEQNQKPAPIEFHKLREMLTDHAEVNHEIELLLERKKRSQEKEIAPAIPLLNKFIEEILAHYEEVQFTEPDKSRDISPLNQLFQQFLIV